MMSHREYLPPVMWAIGDVTSAGSRLWLTCIKPYLRLPVSSWCWPTCNSLFVSMFQMYSSVPLISKYPAVVSCTAKPLLLENPPKLVNTCNYIVLLESCWHYPEYIPQLISPLLLYLKNVQSCWKLGKAWSDINDLELYILEAYAHASGRGYINCTWYISNIQAQAHN